MLATLCVILGMTSLLPSSHASSATSKRVRVREDSDTGTLVARSFELLHLQKTSSFQLLNQKLLLPTPQIRGTRLRHNWFNLDKNSGDVTLRHQVDREALCEDAKECIIHLQIYVVDRQQLLNLDVIIEDVNDNPPTFSTQQILLNVSESAPIGELINLDQYLAQDLDIDNNSMITYSINSNKFFKLEQFIDEADTTHLQLRIVQNLDYERNSIESLTLTAKDGGTPRLTSRVQLLIRITDTNDNTPMFEHSEYSVTLQENLHPEIVILRVKAYDADSGSSGEIRYSISRMNKALARHLVSIDADSGDVRLKDTLDRETHDKISIVIEARDSAPTNQRVGRTRLTIHINDANDNAPVIEVTYMGTSRDNTVYLPENSTVGTYFAYVSAKDADLDKNGKVSMKISSAFSQKRNGITKRAIDTFELTEDGFLSTSKSLDRETNDRFEIVMEACDHGSPSQCSTQSIAVVLLDINDNRPMFLNSKWSYTLSEDTPVGAIITTARANDGDSTNLPALYKNVHGDITASPYGEVTYHIIDGDGTFSIDYSTGEISLSKKLDRERLERYQFTVRARDGDSEMALETKRKMTVQVLDVNDNRPEFQVPDSDNATVYSTILRDDVILRVQAVDYDEGKNGDIFYKIASEDGIMKELVQISSLFLIDEISGDLKLNLSNLKLNSSLGTHKVVVQTYDQGEPSLSSYIAIDVVVTDWETLPENIINVEVKLSGSSVVIIAAVLTSLLIVLLVITVLVFIKCRNERKQRRTYKCRGNAMEVDEWENSSMMTLKKPLDRQNTLSRNSIDASDHSDAEMWNNSLAKKLDFCSENPKSEIQFPLNRNKAANQQPCNQTRSKLYYHHPVEQRVSATRQKNYFDKRISIPPRNFSSHDGDSGRGDSDPDVANSDITTEDYPKVRSLSNSNKEYGNRTSPNSQCTKQCLLYGHSDTCWMPGPLQEQQKEPRFHPHYAGASVNSPLHMEMIDFSRHQPVSEYQESPNLVTIPESRPLRHFWSFPANDLSSIYSNVVMGTQPQKPYHGQLPANRLITHENYKTPANRQSMRMSPLSSNRLTTGHENYTSPDYRTSVRMSPLSYVSSRESSDSSESECLSKRHNVTVMQGIRKSNDAAHFDSNEELSKRSTASLHVPRTLCQPSLTRSASADLLDMDNSASYLISSLDKDERNSVELNSISDNQMFGKVSMQETEEIVENIEKLLDS